MKRSTPLGLLFLILGLVILAAVLGPALLGLLAHPPLTVAISLPLLAVGILLAVFGALMIDPNGVGGAVTTITVKLGNTGIPWLGRRAGDAAETTITVGTAPPTLPKDTP